MEELLSPVATECDEMKMSRLMVANQSLGISPECKPTSQKRDVGHPIWRLVEELKVSSKS